MPAHFVVIGLRLVFVGFLLKADAHVGSDCVKLAERQFQQPLQSVQEKEENQEHFHLLQGVGGLMSLCIARKLVFAVFAHKDERYYRHCRESLLWEVGRVYLLQSHTSYAL